MTNFNTVILATTGLALSNAHRLQAQATHYTLHVDKPDTTILVDAMVTQCPICKKAGVKSVLDIGPVMTTCVASMSSERYDENGKRIPPPKVNTATAMCRCSKGHMFVQKWKTY